MNGEAQEGVYFCFLLVYNYSARLVFCRSVFCRTYSFWVRKRLYPKQDLDPFSHVCTASSIKLRDRQTDWQTPNIIDWNSPHVMHLMRPNNNILIFCQEEEEEEGYSKVRRSQELTADDQRPLSQRSESAYVDIDSYLEQSSFPTAWRNNPMASPGFCSLQEGPWNKAPKTSIGWRCGCPCY